MAATKVTPLELYNPYRFRAYRAAGYNSPNNGWGKVVTDTESWDTNNNFASGTYTAPVTGVYHFTGRASYATSTVVGILALYKNGAMHSRGSLMRANSEYMGLVISDYISLNAGDTVELWVLTQTALTGEVGSENCYFAGILVSTT